MSNYSKQLVRLIVKTINAFDKIKRQIKRKVSEKAHFGESTAVTKVYTKILIETEKVSVIKRRKFFIRAHCEDCQHEVSFFPPTEAAFLICQDIEKIYFWMDSKRIHFQYLYGGKPFICLISLCLADRDNIF